MKELKFVLWICAVGCLVGFVGAVLPGSVFRPMFEWFGVDPSIVDQPIAMYVLRVFSITTGLIGVFFAILARDPLKYDPMLALAAYGLVLVGMACVFGGVHYQLPVLAFGFDAAFCIVTGTLLLVFRHKALQPSTA